MEDETRDFVEVQASENDRIWGGEELGLQDDKVLGPGVKENIMSLTEIEKLGQRGNLWEKNAFSFIHVASETEYPSRGMQKG